MSVIVSCMSGQVIQYTLGNNISWVGTHNYETVGLAREKRIYVKCGHCDCRYNVLESVLCPNCNAPYEDFINRGEVVYV